MNAKSEVRYAESATHGKHTQRCSMCISIGTIVRMIVRMILSISARKKEVSAMTELIDALRYCADEDKICTEQTNCGYYGKGFFCQDALMRDAADAIEKLTNLLDLAKESNDGLRKELEDSDAEIERLVAEVDRKDKALQAWANTWEKRKENAIRHICDHCDTPIEVRLKEGACEDCPIKILIKEIFEEGEQND